MSISDGTCALLNSQQKKWRVVRRAFVPCVRRQAKDCMCACVCTFVTSWKVLCAVDQTPAVALQLFNFLVVACKSNLRKSEIESLGFT